MTPRQQWVVIVLAALTTSMLSGCGSETGAADAAAAAGVPGNDTGGSASTGGTVSGGKATGGAASGGKAAGGAVANTGGYAEGGRTTGEVVAGGAVTGGTATGGIATGGKATGGAATGGIATGGVATGGVATGGVATGGVATGGVATGGVAAGGISSSCLDQITDYGSDGPFRYTTKISGSVNLYVPNVPSGCKVPMVHYSNGTGANCLYYAASLKRLATNGFLTLCYENTNTGAGKYGIEAFKTAIALYPELADYKFGSTGHSQGGMASLVTVQYAEAEWGAKGIYSALAIEPASGFGDNPTEGWQTVYAKIRSPVFMFSGLVTDTLVSQIWVQQAFDALSTSVEAYFWTKSGANHLTTVNQDGEEVLVAWFRWKLLGDQKACQYWKSLPTTNNTWAVADKKNEIACK